MDAPLGDRELLDWIAENAAAIAASCERLPADTPVPACPGWTLADLAGHVAPLLGGWYTHNLTASPEGYDGLAAIGSAPPAPADYPGLARYLTDGATALRERADQVDLDAPTWGFGTVRPARFWLQRAATETWVHRWDAEGAGPSPDASALSPARAAESVDETVRLMWPALHVLDEPPLFAQPAPLPLPDRPLGIRATDSGRAWILECEAGRMRVTGLAPGAELPETTVQGTGHQVVLYLWNRAEEARVSGDPEVAAGWDFWGRFRAPGT